MGIVEKSKAASSVLAGSLAEVRIRMAMERLRMDVRKELLALGADISDLAVGRIIDGLPADVLANELAART